MREYKGESQTSAPILDSVLSYYLAPGAEQYRGWIDAYADESEIPRPILAALIRTESGFDPLAFNESSGARGLGQFVESTASEWGVNVTDAQSSIRGAARYLRFCVNYMNGSMSDGIAAYNWGIGNMTKYRQGLIKSMPAETIGYLAKVYYAPLLIGV